MSNSIRILYSLIGISIMLNIGYSASFNSGKTKKRSNTKSSALTFHLHNRSTNLFSSNGFIYKGSSHSLNSQKTNIDVNLRSLYFMKGNNIYIQPIKNKVIITKFKTPQKTLF
jgi:hypothetical protein